ncbi:unnamed protein product [Adineta steineri]|nr:unnamed protein product [Adineta steineri]CAF1149108.1 unnamed protein product [Adineta steineri]
MFQFKQVFLFILMIKFITTENNFPQILTKTYNQTSNLTSTAILTCHVLDLDEHHVTWFKFDPLTSSLHPLAVGKELFITDKRYSISSYSTSTRDSYWSLEIYQLNLSDEGTYLCKIANRRASVSISIYLHIQIPMFLFPPYLYVEPGTNVKLNCSILIDNNNNNNEAFSSTINWHFISNQYNKTKPNDVHTRKILLNNSLTSSLIIQHAQTYHSGIWTCVYKRQRRTTKLIVEKDVLQRQRISALLSNNSNRRYSLLNFLFFILLINYCNKLFFI